MMLVSGVLGFAFALFLPGSILLRFLRVREGWATTTLIAVPLSLLLNHQMVFLLTSLGIYRVGVMRAILVSALALWIRLSGRRRDFELFPVRGQPPFSRVERLLASASALVILYFLTRWIKGLGTVFDFWDVVFSWNKWAIQWFHSGFPKETAQYPQLIPVLYSLSYQMIGEHEVQFFAKASVTILPVLSALALFSIGFASPVLRKFGFIGSAATLWILGRFWAGINLPLTGLADAPLASILVFWLGIWMLFTRGGFRLDSKYLVYFGGALIGLASLTKQGGLLYFLIYPVLLLKLKDGRPPAKVIWGAVLTGILISLTWYGYKQVQIFLGIDGSNAKIIFDAVGLPVQERLPNAIRVVFHTIIGPGNPLLERVLVIAAFFGVLAMGAFTEAQGMLLVIFSLFLFLVWAFGSSYDTRNLINIAPLVILLFSAGVEKILSLVLPRSWFVPVEGKVPRISLRPLWAWSFLLGSLIFAQWRLPDGLLRVRQEEMMVRIEDPAINTALYRYFEKSPIQGKIMTGYAVVGLLPRLKEHYLDYKCTWPWTWQLPPPEARYLLLAPFCNGPYKKEARELERAGLLERKFELRGYVFYEISGNLNRSR
jgi:hypothetical protein